MRGATSITLQPHQMLPLPRKMMRIIDCRRICNVIYNARSNRHHPPTSPNTAPATQNCTPKSKKNWPKTAEASIPIRGRFEHDPTMIRAWTRHLAPARWPRLLFALRRRILYWKLQRFALRLSIQISPNTAPATKSDTPRSPNTAPATQNDSHDWCPAHMTRHLQRAEQQISSSNITKCCACHAKWLASSILVTYMKRYLEYRRNRHHPPISPNTVRLPRKMTLMIDLRHIWNVIYNARSNRHHPPTSPNTAPATQKCTPKSKRNSPRTVEASIPMRGRFDHDPNMIRAWTRHLAPARSPRFFSCFGDAFCIENYNISRSGYLLKFHRILRLPRKVTLQPHQMLLLPRKMMCIIDCRRIWNAIYNAQSNGHHPPTSPNTAPATQKCTPKSKRNSPRTCIENYNISRSGYLLKFHRILRLPQKVTLQPHQMLLLPRKMILMIDIRDIWNVIYNARSNKHHPPTSPNTAPATQNDSHDWLSSHMERHLQCAEQQASPSNLTKYLDGLWAC